MENIVSVQKYVNFEGGLLIETIFREPLVMSSCTGKKVNIEQCEMDMVCIEGKYYPIIGHYGELVHIGVQVVTEDVAEKFWEDHTLAREAAKDLGSS